MINYSCLVVDDSPDDIAALRKQLHLVPILKQVDECQSVNAALLHLISHPCHLLFLDIKLPGQSGVEWLRTSPHRPKVIITTGYPEFALDCFDLDVIDFLVKPYTTHRLIRAVHRALMSQQPVQAETRSIFLHVNRQLRRFAFDEIVHLEAYGAYTKIHSRTGFAITHESISALEVRLPARQFVRVQKSFIINLDKLTAIEHRTLWLEGDVKIPVGQQFRESLKSLFQNRSLKSVNDEGGES